MLVFLIADIFGWHVAFRLLLLFLSALVLCLNTRKCLNTLEECEKYIERCNEDILEFQNCKMGRIMNDAVSALKNEDNNCNQKRCKRKREPKVTLSYAVEEAAGVRPSGSYIKIPGIKSIPEAENPDGTLSFTANLTQELAVAWIFLMSAYGSATRVGKAVWFCIDIPALKKKLYFKGEPVSLGTPDMGVSAVPEIALRIKPGERKETDNQCLTPVHMKNLPKGLYMDVRLGMAAMDAQIATQIAEQTQKILGLQLKATQIAQSNYLVSQLRAFPTPTYPAYPINVLKGAALLDIAGGSVDIMSDTISSLLKEGNK